MADPVGGGVTAFLKLNDTPANFTGNSLSLVRVNAGEGALEFVDETSDFLSQYALLAGRPGGQVWTGGLNSGDDVTLTATANATPGDIIFKSSPALEAGRFLSTRRFLVGLLAQVVATSIAEFRLNQNATTQLIVENTTNDTAAGAAFQLGTDSATCQLLARSSGFTPIAGEEADALHVLSSAASNGIILITKDAAPIKIKTNQILRATWLAGSNTLQGSGGLTVEGGTGSANTLTLSATSNATPGAIIFRRGAGLEAGRFLATGDLQILSATTLSGILTARRDQNATTAIRLENTTNGTAALSTFGIISAAVSGSFAAFSASFTPSGGIEASSLEIASNGATNGVILQTRDAAPIKFKTNATPRGDISSTGVWTIAGDLAHTGTNLGFYSTAAIAQQTGVAVTAAAIHAACIALGLFTA